MHVVATAGHVDHGKSTLVDALTGMRSDRLDEERRRGLSIELGYTWTSLVGTGPVAFVDVPGHERFVTTMLAGVGPVPVAMLVVAADDPWMPQAAEHLAALDALGVAHGIVAVTRSDLADPTAASARAAVEVAATSLAGAPVVAVSARTGAGLDALRVALGLVLASVPPPDPAADVRLWVDRRFTVRGAGTVVTGTLRAGSIGRGDRLTWPGGAVRVRGLQTLGEDADRVAGPGRVALNLTGEGLAGLDRGAALTTPDAYLPSEEADVRLVGRHSGDASSLPAAPMLHVGSAAVAVTTRPLAEDVVRLRWRGPLPLRLGDRALLRDPGARRVWGVEVLDPRPPRLRRRGAARERAAALDVRGYAAEVERRGVVRHEELRRLGVRREDGPDVLDVGEWAVSRRRAAEIATEVAGLVTARDRAHPLDPGLSLAALADRLGVPPEIVAATLPTTVRRDGTRIVSSEAEGLPDDVRRAVEVLVAELAHMPWAAPTAGRLAELGLDDRGQAAAARAGRLLRLAPGVVVLPGAVDAATRVLTGLPQPFTTSEARQALGTSRRVALPLLDHLDRSGLTLRLPDDRRRLR